MTTENNTLLTGQEREDYIKAHFTPETVIPETLMIETTTTSDYEMWYDGKDEDTQELIDEISDRTSHITDEEQYDEFIESLDDEGIITAGEFENRFEGEFDYGYELLGWVEEMIDSSGYLENVPNFIKNHISYEEIWQCELRYDYSTIDFNNRIYLFRN